MYMYMYNRVSDSDPYGEYTHFLRYVYFSVLQVQSMAGWSMGVANMVMHVCTLTVCVYDSEQSN